MVLLHPEIALLMNCMPIQPESSVKARGLELSHLPSQFLNKQEQHQSRSVIHRPRRNELLIKLAHPCCHKTAFWPAWEYKALACKTQLQNLPQSPNSAFSWMCERVPGCRTASFVDMTVASGKVARAVSLFKPQSRSR